MSAAPSRPFSEHRDTRLWVAIEGSLKELVATREVSINTAMDYVVGYLCQELVAKSVIAAPRSEP